MLIKDPRLSQKDYGGHSKSIGPSRHPKLTNDPLSSNRGFKLASGVSLHNMGAKPNPDASGPSFGERSEETDLLRCIDNFTVAAQSWNSNSFGAIGHRKRRLFNRIRGIQIKPEDYAFVDSDFLHDLDLSLQEELEEVCFQEELLWIQKSSSRLDLSGQP
ncbi:hypothetical protein K1719_026132 [Acacia pycnantha]|nr:hypothetical protein K1719_026132 [Acacia pycnantha]